MKKNVFFFAMVFIASTMLLLTGCQNDEIVTVEQVQQIDPQVLKLSSDPVIQKELIFMKEKMGYNLSNIYVLKGELSGDYGLVEGAGWDAITIPVEYVRDAMKRAQSNESLPQASARHRVTGVMSTSGTKGIVILSNVPSIWQTAVGSARSAWNGLGKTLSFSAPVVGTSASGKIKVSYVDLTPLGYPTTVIAAGDFPVGGVIGANLKINSGCTYSKLSTLTDNQRKYLMAHELAHNIGFHHTDTYNGLALTTTNYTCSNSLDGSFVWKAGSDPVPSWNGFSTCDQDAFDWFY